MINKTSTNFGAHFSIRAPKGTPQHKEFLNKYATTEVPTKVKVRPLGFDVQVQDGKDTRNFFNQMKSIKASFLATMTESDYALTKE